MILGGSSYAFGQLAGYSYFNAASTGASEEPNVGNPFTRPSKHRWSGGSAMR
jgi:hypothetical protein